MVAVTKLLLFDIDGTLLLTGGAGGRAMALAARDVFRADNGVASISMAGRTDAWIVAQMAAAHGAPYSGDLLGQFREAYISHLEREILQPGPRKGILPGIPSLLQALARRPGVHLGLLTGNFERGARIKLEYFDLWRFFSTGAFGDSAHDRSSLLSVALDHVRTRGGPVVHPSEVLIVGDTPLDVAVAVAGGARSLAVATGAYTTDELRASGADVVMKDLSDVGTALSWMGLDTGPD
jgi:phosphoglycolate phosphatase-like HAD superfamily hydrolase